LISARYFIYQKKVCRNFQIQPARDSAIIWPMPTRNATGRFTVILPTNAFTHDPQPSHSAWSARIIGESDFRSMMSWTRA
jgi:hypothetical protein